MTWEFRLAIVYLCGPVKDVYDLAERAMVAPLFWRHSLS